jgi:hypothetical protein
MFSDEPTVKELADWEESQEPANPSIPFTVADRDALNRILEIMDEIQSTIDGVMPSLESLTKSGPMSMMLGSLLKRP